MSDFKFTASMSSKILDDMTEDQLLDEILIALKNDNLDNIAVSVSSLVEYGNDDVYEEGMPLENYGMSFDTEYYNMPEYLAKYRKEFYEKYRLLLE